MPKKVYCIVALALLIGLAGWVAAQVAGTKPATESVSTEKEKAQALTLEERIIVLTKNQEKILAELKVIKENQTEILAITNKIFTRMRRK
jgi:Flp pilus assembly protein CpaB